jgi:DNA-binding beta-propeller fold protein YncE
MATKKKMLQAAAGAVDTYNSIPWDVSNATYTEYLDEFYVGNEEITPEAVTFNDDGTKMYICGTYSDEVIEYNLDTAWDVTTATYNQSLDFTGYGANPQGIFFKPDGTRLYICILTGAGAVPSDSITEYDLSTAWDVSSASYSRYINISSTEGQPHDVFFKPDGTKMYVCGNGDDGVNEFSLSTAWAVTTVSATTLFSTATQDATPAGIHFKSDGTKMYVIGYTNDNVYEYDLSTAWDISTASYNQSFYIALQESNPNGLTFKDDGTKLYVVGQTNDKVTQYELSTAWDISTASWVEPDTDYFACASNTGIPQGLFFKPDGTKLYLIDSLDDDIDEYNLSTAWDLGTASYNQTKSVQARDNTPTGISFNDDGTVMYFTGAQGDDINQYILSTAWDISTATYDTRLIVSSQTTSPQDVYLKPDGTKLYVISNTSPASVLEYDLSTAWDVNSASYNQSKDITANTTYSYALFFKPDGTKMYVTNAYGSVDEYDLSTAWDISTASYSQRVDFVSISNSPTGLYFKDDGTKMYIADSASRVVYGFNV